MTSKLSLELATREEALVWTETVLFAFTNVMAVFGNLLTFYAVYRNHRLRTITNMFVIALAVSDILMCTCCMPFTVVTLFHGRWIFGESYCLFLGVNNNGASTSSLSSLGNQLWLIPRGTIRMPSAWFVCNFSRHLPIRLKGGNA